MWGSEFDDVLEGNDQANSIWGLGGDNTIRGFDGNDTLRGGNGNDTFYGGAGVDDIDGAGGYDTVRFDDLLIGVKVGFGSFGGSDNPNGDLLGNIECIIGSAFADELGGSGVTDDLQGGAGDDLLQGRRGDDTLDGGEGSDRAVYTGSRSEYLITFDERPGRISSAICAKARPMAPIAWAMSRRSYLRMRAIPAARLSWMATRARSSATTATTR